jgi:hypothetical protein
MSGQKITYQGPEEIATTDETVSSLTFELEPDTSEVLAPRTELRLLLTNGYRSLTRWDWKVTSPTTSGTSDVTITKQPPESFWERYDRRVRPNTLEIARFEVEEPLASESITFELDAGVTIQAGVDISLSFEIRRPSDSSFQSLGSPTTIRSVAGPPSTLELRPRLVDVSGEVTRYQVTAFAVDRRRNPVESTGGEIELDTDSSIEGLPETIRLQDGKARFEVTVRDITRIRAVDRERNLRGQSPPLVPHETERPMPKFGAMHFHCQYSHDGDRELSGAYAYAKNWLNLDFAGVTDHTPGTDDWNATVATNENVTDNTFVALHSWEWSARDGHANIYLRDSTVEASPAVSDPDDWPSFGHFDPDDPRPHDVEWPDEVVVIPHHTNARAAARDANGNRYWETYDWDAPNHRTRLVEVYQSRGNFEADTIDEAWGIGVGGRGASVRDALATGYRVGFTAGTDNHTGGPTRHPMEPGYSGLTAVLAESGSRADIWDGLDDRRTYATTGVRIHCSFEVAGTLMGGETVRSGTPDEPLPARIRLHGTDVIDRVQIISDGAVVWSDSPERLDAVYDDVRIPAASESTYYYLRARQQDGNMVWASPVWVDPPTN